MATEQTNVTPQRDGSLLRETVTREFAAPTEQQPTKRFRLKAGAKHFEGARKLAAGDEMELTQAQAMALRDRVEAVDDSEFKVQSSKSDVKRSHQQRAEHQKQEQGDVGKDGNDDAPFGQALVSDTTPVLQRATERDPSALPVDPTAVDPARQGQQTNADQRKVDSGRGPIPPAVVSADKAQKQQKPQEQKLAPAPTPVAPVAPKPAPAAKPTPAAAPTAPAAAPVTKVETDKTEKTDSN